MYTSNRNVLPSTPSVRVGVRYILQRCEEIDANHSNSYHKSLWDASDYSIAISTPNSCILQRLLLLIAQ
jgi:hypothetical protein